MTPLVQALWDLEERQAQWTVAEFEANDHGKARLKRFLQEILEELNKFVPNICHGYIALAGIDCGWFQPIVSINRPLDAISPTPTNGHSSAISYHLDGPEYVVFIDKPSRDINYKGDPRVERRCILKLLTNHECFGFVVLNSLNPMAFEDEKEMLMKAARVLSRIVADAVFSMRLRILGAPMRVPDAPLSELGLQAICLELATRTAKGFGADGSVLRLHDRRTDVLEVVAYEGEVAAELLVPRRPDEAVAGRVFNTESNAWALAGMAADADEELRGISIPREDTEEITSQGIHAFLVMKLACYSPRGGTIGLGTLSFLHKRPHHFSWQEVSLFESYCQNVADTISLYQTNIALDESAENLRVQNLMLTRVEIMALLAHDLGHKTLEAGIAVEDYIGSCRKALNSSQERRTHAHLEGHASKALKATQQIGAAINQFRQLYQGDMKGAGIYAEFDFKEVIASIESTLAGALNRNRVSVKAQYAGSTKLRGYKEVLIQVFFNLFINSLDAMRSLGKSKSTAIFVHAHEDKAANPRRLIIQFWDEGPGINKQVFPDPREIFAIGKTSKPSGTGTGLPVARRLLAQYFQGDISLEDAAQARFRIVLPERTKE